MSAYRVQRSRLAASADANADDEAVESPGIEVARHVPAAGIASGFGVADAIPPYPAPDGPGGHVALALRRMPDGVAGDGAPAFPVTFVDAPPIAANSPCPAVLCQGRWMAAKRYCPCGPCHPQRGQSVAMEYLQASGPGGSGGGIPSGPYAMVGNVSGSGRATTAVVAPYGGRYDWAHAAPSDVHLNLLVAHNFDLSTVGPPANSIFTTGAQFSVEGPGGTTFYTEPPGTHFYGVGLPWPAGTPSRPAFSWQNDGFGFTLSKFWQTNIFVDQAFTLFCDRGGYSLRQSLRAAGYVGPWTLVTPDAKARAYLSALFGGPIPATFSGLYLVGYDVVWRGVNATCRPFRVTFDPSAGPRSITPALQVHFSDGTPPLPYLGPLPSTLTAYPVAYASGQAIVAGDIRTMSPPCGVYSLSVSG